MIKNIIKIVPISMAILFIGCSEIEHNDNNHTVKIIKKIETMPSEKEIGCEGNITKSSDKECSEKEEKAGKLILETLGKIEEKSQLRGKLNELLGEIAKDEDRNYDIKRELEDMVSQTDISKSTNNVKKDLQELVGSLDELGELNEEEMKLGHLDIEDVIDIKNELELLVAGTDEAKREQIELKFESLVNETLKEEERLKQSTKTLNQLVDLAEEDGSKVAKQFAHSIIEDISSKKIAILEAEETHIVIEVKQGDNLSSLAKRYYGDPNKYLLIYNANRDKIESNSIIYPGIRLIIPKL
ncbi:MAG: LysM peptidoglycan-binding domain-containing protein [Sulfurovaceae bacterium]|nr:LysM peptidoglycan-binding domain-containing protein [Sulfurovaceae bacterium]